MGQPDLDALGVPEDAPERSALCLRDPMAEDQNLMRTTMLPAMLDAARSNARQRVADVALFEIGRVFLPSGTEQVPSGALALRHGAARGAEGKPSAEKEEGLTGAGELPEERRRLAAVAMVSAMTSTWNLPEGAAEVDFYWVKGVIEQLCDGLAIEDVAFGRAEHASLHPGCCATLIVAGEEAGAFGEVAPEVQEAYHLPRRAYVMELDLEALMKHARLHVQYQPLPRLPAALRDLALVVPDDEVHSAATLTEATRQAAGEELESVNVFDLYRDPERVGEGNKQIALRLSFRHPDRTLTDEEVDALMQAVTDRLEQDFNARVRTW